MRKFDEYRAAAIADPRFYEPLGRADFGDDLAAALRELTAGAGEVTVDGIWARCQPTGAAALPAHGWKIHVSAVPDHAARALDAVGREFRRTPFALKVLRDTRLVRYATTRWWHPAQVGKVIAIYPTSAEQCRDLLGRLHDALADVRGPYVLSDRRYRDSTCLYYRYGGFRAEGHVTADGTRALTLRGPDGQEWADERLPVYRRPPWVPELFEETTAAAAGQPRELRGYRMTRALRYGGSGGTYLGERISDGLPVVVKEARPNTAFSDDGSDGQERLRREYAWLTRMSGSGVAPQPIELFTEWEHLFLVEEYLPDAIPLVHFIAKHNPLPRNEVGPGTAARYRAVIDKVVGNVRRAIDACHDRGLVYGDLSLTNVMVHPDTFRVWLVDFESARGLDVRQDRYPRTPGFAPPPGSAAREDGRAFDAYGVAAVELALLMPRNGLRELSPAGLARATRHASSMLDRPAADLLARLGLPEVADRTDLTQVAVDAMRFAAAVSTPERSDRLFPADPAVFRTGPWSIAYGAAGVVRALHRITGAVPGPVRGWLDRHRAGLDRLPPGLYHGLAGVGWTLCDAGEPEWGRELVIRAAAGTAGARDLPAGVAEGAAGVGLACLAAWRRTGDAALLAEAARIGDDLAGTAQDAGTGLFWSRERGRPTPVGYAHGSAGIALFLLYLHLATGEPGYLRLGRRALAHDLAEGVEQDGGVLAFPSRTGGEVFYPYWERGAAGIGTALARYCRVVPDGTLRPILDRIMEYDVGGISVSPALFTGMAGPANLALDCAELFGRPDWRARGQRMALAIAAMACDQPEGVAFPGEGLLRFSTDFATGGAGIALVLHRAATGGPDFNYTLDELLPAPGPPAAGLAVAGVGGHA